MDFNTRGGLLQALDTRNAQRDLWFLNWLGKWALLILGIILYTLIIARAADAKAARKYEVWQGRYVTDFLAQQDAARAGMPMDPQVAQFEAEAQELAKVLYGIKDNSTDDMRTLCWCVFNRVDSPDYPGTIMEVIEQPSQWMRYSPDNPVLESIYNVAAEELRAWQDGATRPCGIDLVFMNWTPNEVTLRNTWTNSNSTHYWRAKG